jgi:hypothetical protein
MRRRTIWLLVGVLLLVVGASVYRYATAEEGALQVGMTEEEVERALGYPRSKATIRNGRTQLTLAEIYGHRKISQRREVRGCCVVYFAERDWRNRTRSTCVEYDDDGRAVRWESDYFRPAYPMWKDRLLDPFGY